VAGAAPGREDAQRIGWGQEGALVEIDSVLVVIVDDRPEGGGLDPLAPVFAELAVARVDDAGRGTEQGGGVELHGARRVVRMLPLGVAAE
jgi:hypothetical protein